MTIQEEEEMRKSFENLLYLSNWNFYERDTEDNIICVEYKGRMEIKAATLKKLVEKLTSFDDTDNEALLDFLVTYKTFTDTPTLLKLLMERYENYFKFI